MLSIKFLRKRAGGGGFTLTEVILVTAIISVLTLSLYHVLSNGIKIWERSHLLFVEEDALIFFDKLSMDLRNAVDYSLFDFEGGEKSVVFSTIVRVPVGETIHGKVEAYMDQIGRVEYGFDADHKAIYRRQANYGQAVKGEFGKEQILAQPVDGLAFSYFQKKAKSVAVNQTDQKRLPFSLGVNVVFNESNGQARTMKRLINLPLSF